jgi:hypothetical protein
MPPDLVALAKANSPPATGDELARDGEPDALKDARPVREGLH